MKRKKKKKTGKTPINSFDESLFEWRKLVAHGATDSLREFGSMCH